MAPCSWMKTIYLQSLGTYFVFKASLGTLTPTNVPAPLAKHFHCTTPFVVVLVAVEVGSAESVLPLRV